MTRFLVWLRNLFRGKRKPIFMVENTRGRKVEIVDAAGNRIGHVSWYDPNTREAELYLVGGIYQERPRFIIVSDSGTGFGRRVAKVRVRLPGSRIFVDGKEY